MYIWVSNLGTLLIQHCCIMACCNSVLCIYQTQFDKLTHSIYHLETVLMEALADDYFILMNLGFIWHLLFGINIITHI